MRISVLQTDVVVWIKILQIHKSICQQSYICYYNGMIYYKILSIRAFQVEENKQNKIGANVEVVVRIDLCMVPVIQLQSTNQGRV